MSAITLEAEMADMMVISNRQTAPLAQDSFLRRAWQFSPMLSVLVGANVLFLLIALAGLATDPRLILGAPAWAKTLKFSTSVILYGATLIWMLSLVKSSPRAVKVVAFATGVILMIEMVLIMLQAVRGQAVHFNESTVFDTVVWRVVTGLIGVFYVFNIAGGVLVAREKFANPVLGLAVKLGLALALLGFGLGFLMTVPTAPQLDALQAGQKLDFMGAHNVGAFVDGQTRMLPILGWNMDGGDLRIPHFVGIHAAQFVPLVAALVMLLGSRGLSVARQRGFVWLGAAFYLGITLVVTWQALRNESIIAPGAATLAAVAMLIGFTVLALLALIRPVRSSPATARL